jgi:hypothetical protein
MASVFFALHPVYSQSNLQETITVVAKDKSLKEVLDEISKKGNVNFSYNPREIDNRKKLSLVARNRTVESIVAVLANDLSLTYTVLEKQIILKKKAQPTEKPPEKKGEPAERKVTLSGYLKDAENGELLIGAIVLLRNASYTRATSTNAYGFYSISVPPGQYQLRYSLLGYEKFSETLFLNKDIQKSAALKMNFRELEIVLVSDDNLNPLGKNHPLRGQKLSNAQMQITPTAGGAGDAVKSLQSVPGISFNGEASVQFNVRGGGKGQNAVFIDEAPVYNPSHLLGFYSAIAPDAVNSLRVYKNDYPVRYGGSLSSIIDIRTKDGDMKKFGFSGNLSPLLSSLSLDGPIMKEKSAFFTSIRSSHINYLYKANVPNLNIEFYDFHLKYNHKFSRENRFYTALYSGADELIYGNSAMSWKNNTLTFRWNHLFSDKLFLNTTLYGGSYKYFLFFSYSDNVYWTSDINRFSLKYDFSFYPTEEHTVYFGFEGSVRSFNPGNLNYENLFLNTVQASNVMDNTSYFGGIYKIGNRLSLKYGLRLMNWNNLGPAVVYSFDENNAVNDTSRYIGMYNSFVKLPPRLSALYAFSDKFSVSLAYSRNIQFLHLISNSISPFTSPDVWLPASTNIKPQSSNQTVFSTLVSFTELQFLSELYYKSMNNGIDYSNRPAVFLNPLVEGDLLFGKTKAYGAEFSLKKPKGRFRFTVNYSYSRAFKVTPEINGGQAYPAVWDKPHNFYSDFTFELNERTALNLNFQYASGNRFSSPTAVYYYQNRMVPVYEEKNNDRLPDYHRMDFAIKRRLNRSGEKSFQHYVKFTVYNLYARNNVIAVNFNKTEDSDGNYVIPSDFMRENELIPVSISLFGMVPSVVYEFKFR